MVRWDQVLGQIGWVGAAIQTFFSDYSIFVLIPKKNESKAILAIVRLP